MNAPTQLLIDAGNSAVKAAMLDDQGLGAVQSWPHASMAQFGTWLDSFHSRPAHAWLSSVGQAQTTEIITLALTARNITLAQWRNAPLPAGFRNLYQAPTLGPDRLLAALGARHASAAPVLVVANFGTATTVDLVVQHDYHGGLIAPGVQMMTQSLNRDTANLPLTQGHYTEVPANTHDAIFTGVCAAQTGAVEHMLHAATAFGGPQLVVSGGAAPFIAPYLPVHDSLPHAVLAGLAVVARMPAAQRAP